MAKIGTKELQARSLREAKHKGKKMEDLTIPTFLRRKPAPAPAPTAAEPAPDLEAFTAPPLTVEQSIKQEADRRWRDWMPTMTDRKRPLLRALIKEVRMEFHAIEVAKEGKMPEAPAPAKQKDTEAMTTKTKKTTKTKGAKPKVDGPKEARKGSKLEIVANLLKRPNGCTTADVLKATGWPAVSMPQQAKSAGLTLKKDKVDGVTRYTAA